MGNPRIVGVAEGRYTRTFDGDNQVTQLETFDAQTLQWRRDPLGRRKVLVHPGGGRTTYTCDGVGKNTGLVNPYQERSTWTYDASSQPTSEQLANGTRTTFAYDAAGRNTGLTQLAPGAVLADQFTYRYDLAGRKSRVEELSGDVVTYTYDRSGQLRKEQKVGRNKRCQEPFIRKNRKKIDKWANNRFLTPLFARERRPLPMRMGYTKPK